MSIFQINTPKPPDDVWKVSVDFTDRLDTDGLEELYAASCVVHRLWGYDESVEEYDLEGALRLNVEVERLGNVTDRFSYPVTGQPTAELRLPTDYDAEEILGIVPAESIEIGPPAPAVPPNTTAAFIIQGGEHDNRYAILITALTTEDRRHSCVLRFTVEDLSLTD